MRSRMWMVGVVSLLLMVGCSSPGPSGGEDMAGAGSDLATGANPDLVSVGPPGTPVLLSATLVVHGTMKLSWQNPSSGCTTITVNRKKDAGSYSVAQMVTGVATEIMDMPGHALGTYCYTVVCTLGGTDSPASNEKCVTQ